MMYKNDKTIVKCYLYPNAINQIWDEKTRILVLVYKVIFSF